MKIYSVLIFLFTSFTIAAQSPIVIGVPRIDEGKFVDTTAFEQFKDGLTGNILYVSKARGNNSDAVKGAENFPWADPFAAVTEAEAGDLVWILDGSWNYGSEITPIPGGLVKDAVEVRAEKGTSITTDYNNSDTNMAGKFLLDDNNIPIDFKLSGNLSIFSGVVGFSRSVFGFPTAQGTVFNIELDTAIGAFGCSFCQATNQSNSIFSNALGRLKIGYTENNFTPYLHRFRGDVELSILSSGGAQVIPIISNSANLVLEIGRDVHDLQVLALEGAVVNVESDYAQNLSLVTQNDSHIDADLEICENLTTIIEDQSTVNIRIDKYVNSNTYDTGTLTGNSMRVAIKEEANVNLKIGNAFVSAPILIERSVSTAVDTDTCQLSISAHVFNSTSPTFIVRNEEVLEMDIDLIGFIAENDTQKLFERRGGQNPNMQTISINAFSAFAENTTIDPLSTCSLSSVGPINVFSK